MKLLTATNLGDRPRKSSGAVASASNRKTLTVGLAGMNYRTTQATQEELAEKAPVKVRFRTRAEKSP